MDTGERLARIDSVRTPMIRNTPGVCLGLAQSIDATGLERPITMWTDGTLISGRRRLTAYMMLHRERIPAVYVNTIEDAAKRLLGDNTDVHLSVPMLWSEVCRLWLVLRRLEAPAALKRADDNRRRGVELRRQTQAGKRTPGRLGRSSEDYALQVMCEPFGISYATARRIERIYAVAYGGAETDLAQRDLAREVMESVDTSGNVWRNYQRLLESRPPVLVRVPKPEIEPATAAKQEAAWAKSLPQMEGLTAGLAALGAPNPELAWDKVRPVHARLMAVRRELEKMIRQMKEIDKS